MSRSKLTQSRRRAARSRSLLVEMLEGRALLATAAFNGPSLAGLIARAHQGENTAPQGLRTMLRALQTQMENGPLADLQSGAASSSQFVSEVQDLETSFEQNVDQQLSPAFPNVNRLLKLQGQRIVANAQALDQQNAVGLVSDTDLPTRAQTLIGSLTTGPIRPLGTTFRALAQRTQAFESQLNTLVQSLGTGASPSLTLTDVDATLQADALAYRAAMDSALAVTRPNIAARVDAAVDQLTATSSSIAQANPADAQSQLASAVSTFDHSVLTASGRFRPKA